ncbi:hypothetical protein [Pedobacter sp. ASV28]|uniref:hypothetical protein n=1 Tax=Pedobacter sp. ASV28 TaxID=2795123 RepID=UPI0018EE15E7|nr:hypothetical protein [Pedobacter sp. ASV28]
MRNHIFFVFLAIIFFTSCVKDRSFPPLETIYVQPGLPKLGSRTLVHYWNFNGSALLSPAVTTGGASLSYVGGSALYDAVSPGSLLNARNGDMEGNGLRLRNPAGEFILSLPTTNYKDVVLSFDLQRSDNGPQINKISYSIDGVNFITEGLKPAMNQVDVNWQTFAYDFSNINSVNNNPNFKVRIEFEVNNTGTSGNNRYDNITLDGNIIDPLFGAPEMVHYWDFNNNASFNALITPTLTKGGAALAYTAVWDEYSPGTTINARNGSIAGYALRLRNPAGTFTLTVPTTGYRNIKLTLAVQRSSSGAAKNTITYTLDGTNYISTGIANNVYTPATDPDYGLVTYDFSSITGINNNPNFKIKIDFSEGSTGTSGNNRFDNIAIEGVKL